MNTEYISENKFYQSANLPLAGAISIYITLEGVDKQNPKKAFWIFRRSKELDELVEKFYKRQLLVEPARYFEQISFLKSQLYQND